MMFGRARWQEVEATRKEFNILPIRPDFISELFKVIQDTIPLIQNCRTTLVPNNFFEYNCLTGCAVNLHSIMNSWMKAGRHLQHETDSILHVCGSYEQTTLRSEWHWSGKHHVLHGTSRKWNKLDNTVYWVDTKLAQKKGSKLSHTRKYLRHLDILQRFLVKIIGGKNWIQNVVGGIEDSQQIEQKWKTQLSSMVRLVSGQPPGLLTKEIEKDVSRTKRFVKRCVPVSAARSDKDTDADENIDADQMITERLVESGQSIVLFTQREEVYSDFRVSGLPHGVVKVFKSSWKRSKAILIEKHFRPTCSRVTCTTHSVTIQKRCFVKWVNVEFELSETTRKVQWSECFLYGIKESDLLHLSTSLCWKRIQPKFSHVATGCSLNPALRIRVERLRGARHGITEEQKEDFVVLNARKRCLKRN